MCKCGGVPICQAFVRGSLSSARGCTKQNAPPPCHRKVPSERVLSCRDILASGSMSSETKEPSTRSKYRNALCHAAVMPCGAAIALKCSTHVLQCHTHTHCSPNHQLPITQQPSSQYPPLSGSWGLSLLAGWLLQRIQSPTQHQQICKWCHQSPVSWCWLTMNCQWFSATPVREPYHHYLNTMQRSSILERRHETLTKHSLTRKRALSVIKHRHARKPCSAV